MSLGGAVIGGIIGGIFGGGWGVAIGAVVGGALSGNGDTKKAAAANPRKLKETDERLQFEIWETLFRAFGKLAKSDGVVSREEADMIGSFLRETGMPSAARKELIAAFNAGKTDARPFRTLVRYVSIRFSDNVHPQIMTAFCSLALADGKIDERELAMLRDAEQVLQQYGFVDRWLEQVYGRRRQYDDHTRGDEPNEDDLVQAYATLGLSPQSSDDDVKKAWRNKAKEFHPDRLRGKGVEESVIRLAEEQMRRVNNAYEQIKKARGF